QEQGDQLQGAAAPRLARAGAQALQILQRRHPPRRLCPAQLYSPGSCRRRRSQDRL
ncbi:hypothetical protein LPJ75_006523, partial [Coemansia sp. RSA 2598]